MVTKVPKTELVPTKSTNENDNYNDVSSGEENVEEDKVEIEVDSEENYGNEEDDDQPDVQKAHFN